MMSNQSINTLALICQVFYFFAFAIQANTDDESTTIYGCSHHGKNDIIADAKSSILLNY
jgi:hypothetical protein